MYWLNKLFKLLILLIQFKKLPITQKLVKLKRKYLSLKHNKYITTPEFNKLTAENFAARLKQANLASQNDTADFIENILMIN